MSGIKDKSTIFLILGLFALVLVVTYRVAFYASYLDFDLDSDSKEIIFDWTGGEKEVRVNTDAISWVVESGEEVSWVSFSPTGDRALRICVFQNDSKDDRMFFVRIRSGFTGGFGNNRSGLCVIQKGRRATYLTASSQEILFPERGETKNVGISTDGLEWSVVDRPDWISVLILGDTLVLESLANYGNLREGFVRVKSDEIITEIKVFQSNFHEYVDLGLPSGTLWAKNNVGANVPEGYGYYFAWGETEPKSIYNWDTYKYSNGNSDKLTKYCDFYKYGFDNFVDNLTVLQPMDDAARVNWGDDWCMPTVEQWQELIDYTRRKWTTQNGVNGWIFSAANGCSIFLPSAGYRWEDNLRYAGEKNLGYYWSSSLLEGMPHLALHFDCFTEVDEYEFFSRSNGFPIRPVRSTRANGAQEVFPLP